MFKTFGQEFYPHEALRSLKLIDRIGTGSRSKIVEEIAAQLPQESAHTRRRLATKFVQRYLAPIETGKVAVRKLHAEQPFVRLVARQRHIAAQIELLYLRLVKVDTIVGAVARELFYPVCVAGRIPEGWSEAEFAARNGGRLFADDPLLTRDFILEHARRAWAFTNRATLDRSLRVLLEAGLIAGERMREMRGHPAAFRLSAHDVAPVTFLYGLYEQFLPYEGSGDLHPTLKQIETAEFARSLLLAPSQVRAHCETARRHQFVSAEGDRLRLRLGSLDDVVQAVLALGL